MYTMPRSCVLLLWMYMLTCVQSQDCTREDFLTGPLFDQNFDTSDLEERYSPGRQIRVSCNIGYSGFFKIICTEGKWTSKGTRCQPKSCGHPGDAQFADFQLEQGDDFIFGSKVVYTCQKGYHMVSRKNFRRCMSEGWDGIVPVCDAQKCPAINVNPSVLANGDTEEATFGNVVRFSCRSNDEIMIGSMEMYCDENGEWNGDPPKCIAVTCKVPVIQNGQVTEDIQEYKQHEILYFDCNQGYKRAEERDSKCEKIGLTANWSPTPECERIKCRLLPPIPGTSYQPEFQNVFYPGDKLRVTCGERYWISTPLETTTDIYCREDGKWTISPQVCREVTCLKQAPHVRYWSTWANALKLGERENYGCEYGYKKPGGVTQATCTRSGWEPNPLCEAITCRANNILNAVITNLKLEYRYREQVNYVCKEGFRGLFSLTCEEDGWRWNQREEPRCTAITCTPRNIGNTDILNVKPEYAYREQVTHVCKDGFKGQFSLTCEEKGWSGEERCTQITCDPRVDPNANIERNLQSVYKYSDTVSYTCKTGEGRYSLTCGDNGWVGTSTCSSGCPKAVVPNGFVVGPYKDIVYYTCNKDYKLPIAGWWSEAKCNESKWVGLQQCIGVKECPPPVIPNGKSRLRPKTSYKERESIQITCDEGYRVKNNGVTCQNGKWNKNLKESCEQIARPCSAPNKVGNAVVRGAYQQKYESGSQVTYLCRDGFKMANQEVGRITCQNGEWSKKNIKCQRLNSNEDSSTVQ